MPNLSFVVRHVEGETITPDALTQQQSDAICSCWRRSPTTQELIVAEAVFRQCKTARAWLACDCRGKGALPLMSVFRRDDKLYLRRMTDRAAHSERCLFFMDSTVVDTDYTDLQDVTEAQDAAISARLHASKGVFPPPTRMPSFYTLPSEIGTPDTDPDQQRDADYRPYRAIDDTRLDRDPTCSRLLKWYLHAAAMNRFPQSANPLMDCVNLAKTIPVGPHFLEKYMFFSPIKVLDRSVVAGARRAVADGLDAHAYLLTVVTDVQHLNAQRLAIGYGAAATTLAAPLKTVSVYGTNFGARFPMLALMKMNVAGDVIDGYAHPVFEEKCWCLVDSDNERETLRQLLAAARTLDAQGIRIGIEKPLYEWRKSGFLPDFVVEHRERSGELKYLIIETMGLDVADYRERKERLRAALSEQHAYVEHDFRVSAKQRVDLVARVIDFCRN